MACFPSININIINGITTKSINPKVLLISNIKYDGKFGYVQSQYIGKTKVSEISNPDPVIDDIHTVKWTGVVNVKNGTLNVRLQPTTSAKTCSFSPLRKGVEVGICHQDGDWYLIKYNGKYGYVYSSYIKKK